VAGLRIPALINERKLHKSREREYVDKEAGENTAPTRSWSGNTEGGGEFPKEGPTPKE